MDALPAAVKAGIQETLACSIVGGVVGCTIYGITVLQTYLYYRRYPNDTTQLKVLVAVLFVLDTTTTILIGAALYGYVVTDFGAPDKLGVIPPDLGVENGITVLIGTITQCFFATRLWALSKNKKLLVGFIVFSSMVAFGCGTAITTHLFTDKSIFSLGSREIIVLAGVGNGMSVICDFAITASLCYYLQNGRTGFKRTDTIVDKLMKYAVQRGLLTGLCQAGHMITTVALPGRFLFIPFAWLEGKLYCNALLASLNVRTSLRSEMGGCVESDESHTMNSVTSFVPRDRRHFDRSAFSDAATAIEINISKTEEMKSDEDIQDAIDRKVI